jgi:alpha-tubulin suppressor-like RCC1 family protein
MYTEMPH